MSRRLLISSSPALVAALIAAGCGGASVPGPAGLAPVTATPPVAALRPHDVVAPAGTRNDPYYWLRDDTRKDPDVLAYLNAENAYTEAVLAPTKTLEDTLFGEMRARVQEDDSTVPYLEDGYWYYTRFIAGGEHPIHARRKGTMQAPEEILLDGNQLATGHAFYKIGAFAVSRSGHLLAWIDDTVGRNQFTLHIKDLRTGQLLADTATNLSWGLAWANDDRTLFYVGKDAVTLRQDRVFRHVLGEAADTQVFHEPDASYYVGIGPTKSRRYVQISIGSTTNSEVRLLDADAPAEAPRVLLPRAKDHLYDVDHLDGRFVIRSNDGAKNFRLVEVADGKEGDRAAWRELRPHRADTLLESVAVYRGFIATSIRSGGLRKVEILPASGEPYIGDASEPTYAMAVVDTPDPDATAVRYTYDSMTTPTSTYELDVKTKAATLLKQKPVPGHDPAGYVSEYKHAASVDGTKVPISVVYRKGTPLDGTAPLLVYGYGSYGISMDPYFNGNLVSLLDRGWVFAIAHIRGGQELGRAWYDDGKLLHKHNTFADFITVTEHLVAQRYGARDRVFAMGGSAGGLLMGAVLNQRPDLYRGVAAQVPFVDVVTTMLDETIPLTTNEFDEWGNPKDKASYDYMLSYSPYDNVGAKAYPSIYVKTGLWDSQVQYYEPAKWVARLRASKTDDNLLLLETTMTAGHGGKAGRFERIRESARLYAFFLHVLARPDARAAR